MKKTFHKTFFSVLLTITLSTNVFAQSPFPDKLYSFKTPVGRANIQMSLKQGGLFKTNPIGSIKEYIYKILKLNGASNSSTVSNTALTMSGSKGVSSGLFGSISDFEKWIDEMGESNKPDKYNLANLKANLKALLPYVGSPTQKAVEYEVDRFKTVDGFGFAHYNQTNEIGGEPYATMNYNDSTNSNAAFNYAGCGIIATAMCISTLERKWVNPAEIAIAMQTYRVRTGKQIATTEAGDNGATYWEGIDSIVKEAGYTNSDMQYNKKLDQVKVDECLDKGGLIMYVTTGFPSQDGDTGYTIDGHYVVIREKVGDKYLIGDSIRNNNIQYTFEQIQSKDKGTGSLYIYPK